MSDRRQLSDSYKRTTLGMAEALRKMRPKARPRWWLALHRLGLHHFADWLYARRYDCCAPDLYIPTPLQSLTASPSMHRIPLTALTPEQITKFTLQDLPPGGYEVRP